MTAIASTRACTPQRRAATDCLKRCKHPDSRRNECAACLLMAKRRPARKIGTARSPPYQAGAELFGSTTRRPAPGIASNSVRCGRNCHCSCLGQKAPRQCGRSPQQRAGARPCELVPALKCMRSCARCERSACGAPILPQTCADAVTSCTWYGARKWGRAKREAATNLVTRAPGLQLLWDGVAQSSGLREERRARHGAHFVPQKK